MAICKRCGVHLDDEMEICPLCGTSILNNELPQSAIPRQDANRKEEGRKKHVLQHILWQITAVLLGSCIVATLIIDLSIHRTITWSIYPVTISLIIFPYASLMALWHTGVIFQILTGWVASTVILTGVGLYIASDWPLKLALPLLCALNVIGLLLIVIINRLKVKGLNILAVIFVGIAVFCLTAEGIISFYMDNSIRFQWSVIVAACLFPVTAVILFMYFRARNNPELQKIFHT